MLGTDLEERMSCKHGNWEPCEDSDEAKKLNDLLSAIDRAIDPSPHKGALL